MQKDKTHLPPFISSLPLEEIDGVRFTKREIEIISCILAGRAQKIIASFLLIAPRTVETHTRNIMLKLECNSREGIINFIEKSGKSSLLRNYYQALLIRADFEKRLRSIAILTKGKNLVCKLVYAQEKDNTFPLIQKMEEDLRLAGVTTKLDPRQRLEPSLDLMYDSASAEGDYVIYITSKELLEEFCKEKKNSNTLKFLQQNKQASAIFVFLSIEEGDPPDIFKKTAAINIVGFRLSQSYYLSFFILLKKIFSDPYLDQIITEFKQKYDSIYAESDKASFPLKLDTNKISLKERFYSKKLAAIVAHKRQYPLFANLLTIAASMLTIIVLIYSSFTFKGKQDSPEQVSQISQKSQIKERQTIRSDFIIPIKSVLLNRPELLAQIDAQLKEKDGIRTIALIGTGGAGKTTLARQYAQQQKANVIWEINAETKGSLLSSFETLANALSKTEEDKRLLRNLQGIKDPEEKKAQLIAFVKERLKSSLDWLLIYDNVESFIDIQKYFPHDVNTWGKGRVILTTRDSNIENNKYVNQILQIRELSFEEKLNLFIKIMRQENTSSFTLLQKEEIKKFLQEIPPFPLDVSTAAYYIKATNISYSRYLERLNESMQDFANVQENLLKEAGNYTRTRYGIITLSIKHLLATNKEFGDLLLFMNLVDSQDIPRGFFDKYKDPLIVDDFIYNLKKYSLITNESISSPLGPTLSVHRSTQAISLGFLLGALNVEKNKHLLQAITEILQNYTINVIDDQDFIKMKYLISHLKMFLSHYNLLSDTQKGSIGSELGGIYFYLGDYTKSKKFLDESLLIFNKSIHKDYKEIARTLGYLGNVYRDLGDYNKSLEVLEQCLKNYEKELPRNPIGIAWALVHLGIVYREIGDFDRSKNLLESSLTIYKKNLPENHVAIARGLSHLGAVYRELGKYQQAQMVLGKSLRIYFPKNPVRVAWACGYLGVVYRELGNYEKAKTILEQSLNTYKKYISENHIEVTRVLRDLGTVYGDLERYEEGRTYLEKSLMTFRTYFPEHRGEIAQILRGLGVIYKHTGNYEKTKIFLQESLTDCEKTYGKNHIETARNLMELGKVYLLENNLELAEAFLQNAFKILQKNNHTDTYKVLEVLAELNLKKSVRNEIKTSSSEVQNFKTQARDYLKQALEIVKANFPKNSPHIIRIESKLVQEFSH